MLAPLSRRYGIGDVDDRLRRLTDRNGGDDLVLEGIDRHHGVAILDTHVDARSVTGGPDPVWQLADRYSRHLLESVGAEREDRVQPADGHVGESALRVPDDVDVVRDRTGVEHLEDMEWRAGRESHR